MGFLDLYYSVFLSYKLFTLKALPEIWRLVTPFLITGPQLGLILDPYLLYTYGSQLELESSRFSQPGDFFTYIAFVCTTILVSHIVHSPPTTCTVMRPSLSSISFHHKHLVYLPGRPIHGCHGSWK